MTDLTSFDGRSTTKECLRETTQIINQSHHVDYYVNTYKCIKKASVVSTLNIKDWFSLIRNSEYSKSIQNARRNESLYDEIKESIPCVTYNFMFNRYKNSSNIISGTGLMYIDIDHPVFKIDSLDLSKIYAYYKSFGGNGYAVLVKVKDMTPANFTLTYNSIIKDLDIYEYIDYNAVKTTQFSVISYDTNIFINEDSIIFPSINVAPPSKEYNNRKREKEIYTLDWGAKRYNIRFDNLDEIEVTGKYIVNRDGYPVIKCFIPYHKVKEGRRTSTLLSYTNNLIYLNPWMSQENAAQILRAVNRKMCYNQLPEDELLGIVKSIFKYLEAGTLQPKFAPKNRKIVFSREIPFQIGEKREIIVMENAKKKIEDSKKKIKTIIDNWDFAVFGKITQRGMYKNHPISKKTVEKYWPEFRELISEINEKS